MKTIFLPVYRMAASYTVSFGRRWSLLEQLLLVELSKERRTSAELAQAAALPDRLIIEALINLLRASWIEVRAKEDGVYFAATPAGHKRAVEEKLPVQLQRAVRWMSLCVDRLTGAWLRADDLELIYENDLPESVDPVEPKIHTYNPTDGVLRDLVYLSPDEAFESFAPSFRTPSKPYARVTVTFDKIDGLPTYTPLGLQQAILEIASGMADSVRSEASAKPTTISELAAETIGSDNFIVGGPAHLTYFRECLANAKSKVIVHSCFLNSQTIELFMPDWERAAKRGIHVELLWGLHTDSEGMNNRNPMPEVQGILAKLTPIARDHIHLSSITSDSHAKILMFDSAEDGSWTSVVGSCNFLSSRFDEIETSVAFRSKRLAFQLMGRLIAGQLPPSSGWSATARRLNRIWEQLRREVLSQSEYGAHRLLLLADQDHYACVTAARDRAKENIVVGCDLFGMAAETSVLVPMTRAAELGKKVQLLYQRPSKLLRQEGRTPDKEQAAHRGLSLEQIAGLHAKFIAWDNDAVGITSFNWLSTVAEGTRTRGAELGVLITGPNARTIFAEKLHAATGGTVDVRHPMQ